MPPDPTYVTSVDTVTALSDAVAQTLAPPTDASASIAALAATGATAAAWTDQALPALREVSSAVLDASAGVEAGLTVLSGLVDQWVQAPDDPSKAAAVDDEAVELTGTVAALQTRTDGVLALAGDVARQLKAAGTALPGAVDELTARICQNNDNLLNDTNAGNQSAVQVDEVEELELSLVYKGFTNLSAAVQAAGPALDDVTARWAEALQLVTTVLSDLPVPGGKRSPFDVRTRIEVATTTWSTLTTKMDSLVLAAPAAAT